MEEKRDSGSSPHEKQHVTCAKSRTAAPANTQSTAPDIAADCHPSNFQLILLVCSLKACRSPLLGKWQKELAFHTSQQLAKALLKQLERPPRPREELINQPKFVRDSFFAEGQHLLVRGEGSKWEVRGFHACASWSR